MSASNSPLAYADIRHLADRALANGRGVMLRCHDLGESISQRTRFYKMRDLDRRANKRTYPDPDHPMHGTSVYDTLVLSPCQEERDGEQVVFLAFEVSSAERLAERIEEL